MQQFQTVSDLFVDKFILIQLVCYLTRFDFLQKCQKIVMYGINSKIEYSGLVDRKDKTLVSFLSDVERVCPKVIGLRKNISCKGGALEAHWPFLLAVSRPFYLVVYLSCS